MLSANNEPSPDHFGSHGIILQGMHDGKSSENELILVGTGHMNGRKLLRQALKTLLKITFNHFVGHNCARLALCFHRPFRISEDALTVCSLVAAGTGGWTLSKMDTCLFESEESIFTHDFLQND